MISPRLPLVALLAASVSAGGTHAAEPLTPEAAAAQLAGVLSLFGAASPGTAGRAAEVKPDGDAFTVRVPLSSLSEPTDAAFTARAQPLADGIWNITSANLPSAGVFTMTQPAGAGPAARFAYSIGQQNITARIDPSLAQPSPFQMELRNLTVTADNAGQHSEQTIRQQSLQGVVTGEAGDRMTLRAQGTSADWHIATRDPGGVTRNSTIRSSASAIEIEGLDRTQAQRLRIAMQGFVGAAQSAVAGAAKPPGLTDEQRNQLASIIDLLQGILGRISIEQTTEGIHIDGPGDTAGDVGRIRVGLAGESRDDHMNANIDLAVHDLKVASVPPEFAAYVPTLIKLRPAVTGVRTSAFMRFLHHAVAGADPAALQAEALALMNEPGARLGIEDLSLTAGPLRIEGSGRMVPANGAPPGLEAHLMARGVDATLASVQGNPKAQQIIPLVFLAKGMAKVQGDALVWDLAFAGGVLKVNGVPLGQPAPPSGSGKPPPAQKPRQ